MKILMLCLRSPYPPNDGGTIAMYNVAVAMKKAGARVSILSFNTKKHFVDPSTLPDQFVNDFNPKMVYLDASVRLLPAFLNLFKGGSYNVNRFDNKLFHHTLMQLLEEEEYDIIQMESLFMTPFLNSIRKKSKAKVVLRAHNVEHQIWQRLAAKTSQPFKKWYLSFLSGRLKQYETQIINQLDGIVVLTEEDKQLISLLGCKTPVFVSPIGVDTSNYPVHFLPNRDVSIVHLGSMDWLPNIEGVDWFLNRVLPLLNSSGKKISVHLAGKAMPQRIFSMADQNLSVSGRIDNAKLFLADKQVMIVPLLSGGGMRVKIIEGMAMGKTIISTTIGAEGIRYKDHKNILIADTPESFCEAILKCVNDPGYADSIGKEARKLVENIYENKIIGSDILEFFSGLTADRSLTNNYNQQF